MNPRVKIAAVILAALGLSFGTGWALGHRRGSTAAPGSLSCDAGVNASASAEVTVSTSPAVCACDAGVVVKVRPVVVYLPGDAGPCVSEEVEISESETAEASTAPTMVTASASADAGAVFHAEESWRSMATDWRSPEFAGAIGVGYSFDSHVNFPIEGYWHPGHGPVGLGVLVNVCPTDIGRTNLNFMLQLTSK